MEEILARLVETRIETVVIYALAARFTLRATENIWVIFTQILSAHSSSIGVQLLERLQRLRIRPTKARCWDMGRLMS
jgi:protoheme ferro-lyase